ncbi:MAG: protecting protein DprA, DNA processing protein [Candidatus Peregrinibacteria bacterium GW2011_GWF2_43_17]|nr:MAG: protecting protein DprA, DNA processing protein [Candidatus Peregrinibacteria bacterium GW2011_GWF2_43_17]KKT19434.1 MAG: protecting protein DprA protein [Candidatus Peregrinibacteria bacterium GW2011_GWA2_43_8]HAU40112.1 DNA-protecting protein DprA [Candidatus Peregrinibacteria bacterium]
MDEIYFHIWQKTLYGSPKLLMHILKNFNFDPKAAWRNFDPKITTGTKKETLELIQKNREEDPIKSYEELKKLGIKILTITSPLYPEYLKNISAPPVAIYYRGDLKVLQKPAIAIVGTRKISFYGQKTVRKIVNELSGYDLALVSGLAYGIDAFAHKESLKIGIPNIAVLANGLDQIYPSEHIDLAKEIIKNGLLISESPPRTPSQKFMFPIRNRLIAGLAQAVIVAEAPERSGALITAEYAFSENRLVYAVPGDIDSYRHVGCHNLIKSQKAVLLTHAKDVVKDLNLAFGSLPIKCKKLSKEQELILRIIEKRSPAHLSSLEAITRIPQCNLIEELMEMELSCLIKNIGGMNYVCVR